MSYQPTQEGRWKWPLRGFLVAGFAAYWFLILEHLDRAAQLHLGVTLLFTLLWVAAAHAAPRLSVRAMLAFLVPICIATAGAVRLWTWSAETDRLYQEAQQLGFQRCGYTRFDDVPGDAIARDTDQARSGDAAALERLLDVVRRRGVGWGRAVVALAAEDVNGFSRVHYKHVARPAVLECGNPFLTFWGGWDRPRLKRALWSREQQLQEDAAWLRRSVLEHPPTVQDMEAADED